MTATVNGHFADADRATDPAAFLRLLHSPGNVFEIRALDVNAQKKRIDSGFFDDPAKARESVLRLDKAAPRGIYLTANPLKPAMLARAANRVRERADKTAADDHVARRRWLIIDIDPTREGGVTDIAATDDEIRAAWDVAEAVRGWLLGMGFPEPIECNSGNGRYLLFPIDLPNDPASADLVRRVLLAIEQRHGTTEAHVDLTMFNASRIIRVMGTTNRKGDSLPDRPHRQSTLDHVPDYLQGGWSNPVPVERLEAVAALATDGKPQPSTQSTGPRSAFNHRLNIDRWLASRGIEHEQPVRTGDGRTKWKIVCPFNADHGRDAAVFQSDDGKLGFNCFHNGCAANSWAEVRDAIGAPDDDHYDPPRKRAQPGDGFDAREYGVEPEAQPNGWEDAQPDSGRRHRVPPREFKILTARELAAGDFAGRYLIEEILAWLEFCILVGPKKSLKTTLALLMAGCIAIGRPLFGIFKVPERMKVGFFSGESGAGTLQDAMRRVARHLGRSAGDFDNLFFCFDVPRLDSQEDVAALERIITERGLQVVFLDCFYRMLGAAADDVANLFKMGSLLASLMDMQRRTGCTIVLLHHCPKHAPYAEPELDNAAYAGSSEAARQWILLARRCAYDAEQPGHHELWFSTGGSMGHSELLALNIDEGSRKDPEGRRFELEVISAGEARAEAATADDEAREQRKATRKQVELDGDRRKLLDLLTGLSAPETHTKMRAKAHLSGPRFELALDSLLTDKSVILLPDFTTKGNNRTYDAYWLASRQSELPQRSATVSNGQTDADGCVASQQSIPSIEGLTVATVQEACDSATTDAKADRCETFRKEATNADGLPREEAP